MSRPTVLILVLLATALAGCSDDGTEPTQGGPDVPVQATDTTGIIVGVVVDATIVPIPDASVSLSTGQETTTDANGTFAFGDLDPGAYPLTISKTGYFPVDTVATVEAGVDDPPLVKVQLERDLATSPYVTVYQWEGYIQCGLSVVAACGALDIVGVGDDEFITTHATDRDPSWVQSEMIWDSTQSVSDELWIWHSYSDKQTGFNGSFGWVQGPSPLLMVTHADDLNQYGNATEWRDLGRQNDITPRVFSGSISGTRSPLDGCYPLVLTEYCGGVGFTVEQRFTVYTHLFYRYTPPEDWRFSEDPSTPQPPA